MSSMNFNVISGNPESNKAISLSDLDFSAFIGQEEVLSKICFYLASHSLSRPFPSLLFTGSHGLGKTYMAKMVAGNMQRHFAEINASMIDNEKDFIEQFVMGHVTGDKPATILIDECHKLPKDVMTALLSVLNPSDSPIVEVAYKNYKVIFDMRLINFILATTDAYQMVAPLKNRCQEVYFRAYRDDELIKMLLYYLESDENVLQCDQESLIRACRNRGRDTYILADNIMRYWKVYKENEQSPIIKQTDMEHLFNILGMDNFGLYNKESELIRVVDDNGPISASNLAMMLMVSEDNVKYELEVRPRELGFIKSTSKGRIITSQGKEYLT